MAETRDFVYCNATFAITDKREVYTEEKFKKHVKEYLKRDPEKISKYEPAETSDHRLLYTMLSLESFAKVCDDLSALKLLNFLEYVGKISHVRGASSPEEALKKSHNTRCSTHIDTSHDNFFDVYLKKELRANRKFVCVATKIPKPELDSSEEATIFLVISLNIAKAVKCSRSNLNDSGNVFASRRMGYKRLRHLCENPFDIILLSNVRNVLTAQSIGGNFADAMAFVREKETSVSLPVSINNRTSAESIIREIFHDGQIIGQNFIEKIKISFENDNTLITIHGDKSDTDWLRRHFGNRGSKNKWQRKSKEKSDLEEFCDGVKNKKLHYRSDGRAIPINHRGYVHMKSERSISNALTSIGDKQNLFFYGGNMFCITIYDDFDFRGIDKELANYLVDSFSTEFTGTFHSNLRSEVIYHSEPESFCPIIENIFFFLKTHFAESIPLSCCDRS